MTAKAESRGAAWPRLPGGAGEVRVHQVVCAVDCGTMVKPDTVKAQMEGGIEGAREV